MKKATSSPELLAAHLLDVAAKLQAVAGFDFDDDSLREFVSRETCASEFFSVGEATAAPAQGGGQRVKVTVGWVWWPAQLAPERGAELIVSEIRALPSVEEVSTPSLDPQLGAVWQSVLTLRVTQ